MYYLLRYTHPKALTEQRTIILRDTLEKTLELKTPVTLMRNGSLLVQATTRNESSILSSLTSLRNIPLISTPEEIRKHQKEHSGSVDSMKGDPNFSHLTQIVLSSKITHLMTH